MGFQKGNKIALGRKHTQETKRKISEAHTRRIMFTCLCCANKSLKIPSLVRDQKFCSNRCAKKYLSGKNHYNWCGGISSLRDKIKNSIPYRKWRFSVYKRDNFTCQICKKSKEVNSMLEVDHFPLSYAWIIKKNTINSLKKALKCNELWDINNGRTLCSACHRSTETYGYKNVLILKTKNC